MVLPLDHASLFQWWYNAYDQRSFQIAQLCFQEAEEKCLPAYALNSTKRGWMRHNTKGNLLDCDVIFVYKFYIFCFLLASDKVKSID
jgi:hypothetical protein